MKTYEIVRYYRDGEDIAQIQKTGLTLEEAKEHCKSPDTKGDGWFDGYREE